MHYGMHPVCINFNECKDAFISQMKAGLDGAPSSLKMIPTYLSADGLVREGETAIAIDIGGTNLRVALLQVIGGRLQVVESSEAPVPGLSHAISKAAFFSEIVDKLQPVIHKSSRIGICFSHAAEILPNKDGRLISFSKEITVLDSEGMEIAHELSATLKGRGYHEQKAYALLNDTAAVLLIGAAPICGAVQPYDSYIGFVLGTGQNLSYIEKTDQIKKLQGGYQKAAMIVNTESGYFDRIPPGAIDTALNKTTVNPLEHQFEKMMSGRYLGQLILLTLQKAVSDGLFSEETGASILSLNALSLSEISSFLSDISARNLLSDLCKTREDRTVFAAVAERIIERGAKLAVVAIAAVMEKTDTGRRPEKPVCVVAEGSTFHKLFSFEDKFNTYILSEITAKQGRYCQVKAVENATLLGTAFAALIN